MKMIQLSLSIKFLVFCLFSFTKGPLKSIVLFWIVLMCHISCSDTSVDSPPSLHDVLCGRYDYMNGSLWSSSGLGWQFVEARDSSLLELKLYGEYKMRAYIYIPNIDTVVQLNQQGSYTVERTTFYDDKFIDGYTGHIVFTKTNGEKWESDFDVDELGSLYFQDDPIFILPDSIGYLKMEYWGK